MTSLLLAILMLQAQPSPVVLDFEKETVGAEPKSAAPVVGRWSIGLDGANKVLVVDGRQWKQGQPAASLAESARAIYGDRYAEFLDGVTAYAYFPYVVVKDVAEFRTGDIELRFKTLEGRIDQAAGILFDLKPNGDYLALRANALESNLVLWRVRKGKRTSLKWVRNVPTPSHKWQTLTLRVIGRKVEGLLDGKPILEHTLDDPVSGKVGVWSKADSYVLIDDMKITPGA